MFISLDPWDEPSWNADKALGNQYKEKTKKFDDPSIDLSLPDNQQGPFRISFIGHGSQNAYGQMRYSPEQFAQYLIARSLPNDKPVVIDLIGCATGFVGDKGSYALRLFDHLKAKGYDNLQINVHTNLVAKETIMNQKVVTFTLGDLGLSNSVYLQGVSREKIDKDETYKKLNRELDALEAQKKVLVAAVAVQSNPDAPNRDINSAKENISKMERLQNEINNKTSELKNHLNDKLKTYHATTDIRAAFDAHPNYQITAKTRKDLDLQEPARQIVIMLKTQIGLLNEEKASVTGSLFADAAKLFGHTVSTKAIQAKIYKLENIITVARGCGGDTNILAKQINDALVDKTIANGRTKMALQKMQNHVSAAPPQVEARAPRA